ncbi:MAG TPA: M20 family metallopeptidase [Salinivirgaceae bacterium]|nr:M20 family metallopeptidase [Salinivirgaceae bacterium]
MDFALEINQRYPQIIENYHRLHSCPELSNREEETHRFILEKVKASGVHSIETYGTGIVCTLEGTTPGMHLAFRAEMDALPIDEQTGVGFASINQGVMHACGHDFHMACLLSALEILGNRRNEIQGKVTFVFQPSEESLPGGAKQMLQQGLFAQEKPDLMIAQHVFPDLPVGHFGFRSGKYMASGDEIYVVLHGKGGHAALPHQSNDVVVAMSQTVIALQTIRSRIIDPTIPFVLSFGKAIADGANNVLPMEARLEGTMRTLDEYWRREAKQHIMKITEHSAAVYGCSADVQIVEGYPVLENNPKYTEELRSIAQSMVGSHQVHELPIRMTTDDFAYFAQQIPSVYYRIGVGESAGKLHTPNFLPPTEAFKPAIEFILHILSTFNGR